ncbi:MAG: hypothetical protein AAGD01_07530 [Acidobacteriota bacterium]
MSPSSDPVGDSIPFLRQRLWLSHRELRVEEGSIHLSLRTPFQSSEQIFPFDTILPDIQRSSRPSRIAGWALGGVAALALPVALLAWSLPDRGLGIALLYLGSLGIALAAFFASRSSAAGFLSSLGDITMWANIPDRETVDEFLEGLQSLLRQAQTPDREESPEARALFALWNQGLLSTDEYETLRHRLASLLQAEGPAEQEQNLAEAAQDELSDGEIFRDDDDKAVVN